VQSRTPLYLRATGYGIPSVQIDGNDPLISYAVTKHNMDRARSGHGPQFIEALTYRMGAHTTSDDPTKYRDEEELQFWAERDPIGRFRVFLGNRGHSEEFFDEVDEQARDEVSDFRREVIALPSPPSRHIFEHVYSSPHKNLEEQAAWLAEFEDSFIPKEGPS